ncbi:MAG TPA: ADP-ribosylglycohydrolase family protein [Chthoniobacterales bacterium]
MIGAILGDIIGSPYEHRNYKGTDFALFSDHSRFTDDTVLTVAVADALLHGQPYAETFVEYFFAYPKAGYGGTFIQQASTGKLHPYHSWGNGSAMRVCPVGFAFDTAEAVLAEAKRSAEVTHNHPEGIKGAQATALAVFLARQGETKAFIKNQIVSRFGYDLSPSLDVIRSTYRFDVSCQGSVPQALTAFLESTGYEDAVRKAVSLGGDSDTIACIAGGIAHAFFGPIPPEIEAPGLARLDQPLLQVVREFSQRYLRWP